MKTVVSLLAILVICTALPATADIINVPVDQPTIQAGIDAAAPGDEVVVADGTYVGWGSRNLDFGGKAITVRSANGPENCIIDCQGEARAFIFYNGEAADSIVQGFTITNGLVQNVPGGGIYCYQASPTIQGNVITQCQAAGGHSGCTGGGIACNNYSNPRISQNTISNCTAACGGGISIYYGSDPVIEDNLIQGNQAIQQADDTGLGGGIYESASSGTPVIGNTISGNQAYQGGGIYSSSSGVFIQDNIMTLNTANIPYDGGGAVCMYFGSGDIRDNLIADNSSGIQVHYVEYYGGLRILENTISDNQLAGVQISYGHGQTLVAGNTLKGNGQGIYVFSSSSTLSVVNNVISDNSTGIFANGAWSGININLHLFNNLFINNPGSAMSLRGTGLLMESCSLVGNGNSSASGGAITTDDDCCVEIRNSILWDNHDGGLEIFAPWPCEHVDISHCCIDGGYATVQANNLVIGPGVFDADPWFLAGPDDDYYLSQTAAGQPDDSPCLDAGENLAVDTLLSVLGLEYSLAAMTTRTDHVQDQGHADLGYHRYSSGGTVACTLNCLPNAGTLPFDTLFSVGLYNRYTGQTRRLQFQVDVTLAGGQYFPNWRRGWQNVQAGQGHSESWWQTIPALSSVYGQNDFLFSVVDVTPAPYNLPPYPPAGDTATATCSVIGN